MPLQSINPCVFNTHFSKGMFSEVTASLCRSPRDSKVFEHNTVVVWMISLPSYISSSTSLYCRNSETVPKAPTAIDITVTFMFQKFYISMKRLGMCLSFHFLSILLYCPLKGQTPQDDKVIIISFKVFHFSVSRWFLTGVWERASLLKSPRHFSVFWQISIML